MFLRIMFVKEENLAFGIWMEDFPIQVCKICSPRFNSNTTSYKMKGSMFSWHLYYVYSCYGNSGSEMVDEFLILKYVSSLSLIEATCTLCKSKFKTLWTWSSQSHESRGVYVNEVIFKMAWG